MPLFRGIQKISRFFAEDGKFRNFAHTAINFCPCTEYIHLSLTQYQVVFKILYILYNKVHHLVLKMIFISLTIGQDFITIGKDFIMTGQYL